jgi:hypothetical protein
MLFSDRRSFMRYPKTTTALLISSQWSGRNGRQGNNAELTHDSRAPRQMGCGAVGDDGQAIDAHLHLLWGGRGRTVPHQTRATDLQARWPARGAAQSGETKIHQALANALAKEEK